MTLPGYQCLCGAGAVHVTSIGDYLSVLNQFCHDSSCSSSCEKLHRAEWLGVCLHGLKHKPCPSSSCSQPHSYLDLKTGLLQPYPEIDLKLLPQVETTNVESAPVASAARLAVHQFYLQKMKEAREAKLKQKQKRKSIV